MARFPATRNQQSYWHRARSGKCGSALNVAYCQRLKGAVSDMAVEVALQGLIARHEILRTRFRETEDGTLVQEVLATVPFKLGQADLRHLVPATREEERLRLVKAHASQPFDFSGDSSPAPLLRGLLIRIASDEAYLYLIYHHLVIDGWSLDLAGREIGALAAASDARTVAELPPVDMQFGDYAQWQIDMLVGDALDEDRAYWHQKLANLSDFRVPPDRDGVPEGKPSEIHSILLPLELSSAFEALARTTNHTLFSLAGAAAATALHDITDASEVVLGTQIAGRDDPASEVIVGPIVNTVILRVPTSRGSTFLTLANTVRANVREAMAHQLLPFAEVERLVRVMRGDGAPPFRVNLTVQRAYISSASVQDSSYGDFRTESVASPSVGALWDLNLFMVGREEGWRLSCEYPTELYDGDTVDALLQAWRATIERAIAAPEFLLAGRPDEAVSDPAASAPAATSAVTNPRLEALRKRILAVQPKGDGTPIIAINNVSVFYPVAKAIGPEHPFYDIQFCPSATPVALPKRHFTDHARDAVEMIRLARPHGPYILFGLCVMGAVAIEAARILQSEGETVELVVLNDTYRPGYREQLGLVNRVIRAWQVEFIAASKLWRRARSGELAWAQFFDKIFSTLGISRLVAWITGSAVPPDDEADGNRWFIDRVLMPSQGEINFQRYTGRVVVFRNEDMPNGRLFPHDFGWEGAIDGDFEVVSCPGTHDTMFRTEGAQVIGATIRRLLAQPN